MKIATGISPQYVKGWTVEKAVREVVQNYLDSREEFGCDGSISWANGMANVKDNGPGLEIRHFALGISEKSDSAIGKFGEGLKLALLVLAREGRRIEVWANRKIISPIIEMNDQYGTEVMSLIIRNMAPRHAAKHKGTSVKFQCSKEELEAGKSYFMQFIDSKDSFKWLERGKISLPGGDIFVNGAKVGSIPGAIFSYHLEDDKKGVIGNRDREVIDMNVTSRKVKDILTWTSSQKVMRTLCEKVASGDAGWEATIGIDAYILPQPRRKLWKRAWNAIFGEEYVLGSYSTTQEESSQLEYKGYRVIRTPWTWTGELGRCGIPTAFSVFESLAKSRKIAYISIPDLTEEERVVFSKAKRLVRSRYSDPGKIKIADDLNILCGATGRTAISGCYDSETDTIYLKREVLLSLIDTVHTLLHETVHKVTGETDLTAKFQDALLMVAVKMMI